MALGMDLMGGVMYPRKAGTCLMMISADRHQHALDHRDGKIQRKPTRIEDAQDHLNDPDDTYSYQHERIAHRQISIPQQQDAGQDRRR